jgi:hypothetical protein
MRLLYEKYWNVASFLDQKHKIDSEEKSKKRWHPRTIQKTNEEFELTDKILGAVDALSEKEAHSISELP